MGNKIKFHLTPSGKILYEPLEEANKKNKLNVIYARVSNTKQKDDLNKQILVLREFATSNGVIVDGAFSDIASGMNENRKDFNKLMDLVLEGEVDTIYVSYKDRFTRFGFGYLESICSKLGTKIVVVNSTSEEDFQTELTQDLISIIHHFSMKMYSNRRKEIKELEKSLKSDEFDR